MRPQQPDASQDTASLLHRLAGPSSNKAGLAKDQSEINKTIAEVSKGSAFYENEKRKDKEVTERVEKLLRQRDDALRGVDIEKIEKRVDHILFDIEAERDLSQIIVHVDMDAFYANVELQSRPELAGKAFGVGGGVLCTASYEARKFGVRSGMAEFVARKLCPELIVVRLDMSKYAEISKRIMDVLRKYDPTMLAASVDEGYLNITPYCKEHDLDPEECVQRMRQDVFETTKLTVSAGIAPNKNKPNGQFRLAHDREAIKFFMQELPIRKIPGIGRVNERLLDSVGIKTCGDIHTYRAMLFLMDKQFALRFMLRTYLGIASNIVQPWGREERKSIGSERTFSPISDKEKILQKLENIAAELEEDMTSTGWTGRTVTLKYKLDTYQVFTRAKSLDRYISSKTDLFAIGKELLQPEWPLRIRLIGLRVTKLKDLRKKDDEMAKFFGLANTSPSPSKKRKAPDDDTYVSDNDGGDDDAMPGYHEYEADVWDVDEEPIPFTSTEKRPYKPISAPASSQPSSSSPEVETLACPICSGTFRDNDTLNSHIDWCLSRDAIRTAQAEGSKSAPSSTISGKSGTIPVVEKAASTDFGRKAE
ncbi:hypothetical protein K488DRAFT_75721 [Vararia minispora EC-137]|uniref:Uncharacterized protein n=1 Tax=Vararia minispora EC-137 TaxID=1314806 RepID=A0ACB8QZ77_9AGAM|nr:hypothetical protein K488DRAFT_75721 [Vararia minispora EC-137]